MAASAASPQACVDLLLIVGLLKVQKRTGWVNAGVPSPESVAEHMYRMGLAALLFGASSFPSSTPVDAHRACLLSLVHDLAEAITSDIVPFHPMGKDAKHKLEVQAMHKIRDIFPPSSPASSLFLSLWEEYEGQSTPESRLVKDLDRFEMILQAYEYEVTAGSGHGGGQGPTPCAEAFEAAGLAEEAEEARRTRTTTTTTTTTRRRRQRAESGGGREQRSECPTIEEPLSNDAGAMPPQQQQQRFPDLSGFFESVRGKFRDDTVRAWAEEVERRRNTMRAARLQREAEERQEEEEEERGRRVVRRSVLAVGVIAGAAAAVGLLALGGRAKVR